MGNSEKLNRFTEQRKIEKEKQNRAFVYLILPRTRIPKVWIILAYFIY